MTRVVIAPDKFKGSLGASEVAASLRDGLLDVDPDIEVDEIPVADGGEGTLEAVVSSGFVPVSVEVCGPTGEPQVARFGRRGDTALIELAEVSGINRLPGGVLRPLDSNTYGLGLMVREVLDRGAKKVVFGLGGSSSTDGGSGLLRALGLHLLDADGSELPLGGGSLLKLDRVDRSGLDERLGSIEVVIASDVSNPLLGSIGAARVYGPQKGASEEDVEVLEAGMKRWAAVTGRLESGSEPASEPGAGAAGGVGYGLLAYMGARMGSGIDLILELLDFDHVVRGSDLVITGEGTLDHQSLQGKTPIGVARAAAGHGAPTVVVAGRVELSPEEVIEAGFAGAYSLGDLEPDVEVCMRDAGELLRRMGALVAKEWLGERSASNSRHLPGGGR